MASVADNERVLAVTPIGYAREVSSLQERAMSQFGRNWQRRPLSDLVTGLEEKDRLPWMKTALEAGDRETAGPMGALLAHLRTAIESVRAKGFAETELYQAAINENARLGADELLRSSRVVEEAA